MRKTFLVFSLIFLSASFLLAQPQHYNYTTGSGNTFPLGQTAGKFVNWLFPAGAFNMPTPCPPGQQITKVYIRMYNTGSRTYTNLHILMAQDSITNLTMGQFYSGTWDTVYVKDTSLTSTGANTWLPIQLQTPYPYDPTKSLIVGIGQCGGAGSGMYVLQTSISGIHRTWSVGGCPFTPYSGGDGYNLDMGIDVEPAIPSAPAFYNYMTTGSNNSFPFGIAAGKMVQWLYPPAAGTGGWHTPNTPQGGGMINAVYVWVGSTYPLGPTTYSQFRILMGQTNLTTLTQGQFFTGTMDTVFYRASVQLQGSLNSWMRIILDTPFVYDPSKGTVLQIGQCGASGVLGYPACQTSIGNYHRVWSAGGCPYTPYSGGDGYIIHTGINIVYPTGVSSNNNNVPGTYRLEQNYPNPFNPVTNINYSIPKAGNVKLVVYDVLGREVTTLVNEVKTPGSYSVSFDASNLSSGVYIYKIQAGNFTDAKKMMLVK